MNEKDLVIPKKLKALLTKLREWEILKSTGGENKHLNKIISARDAYVFSGLVTAELVDEYIRIHYIPKQDSDKPSEQVYLWDKT